MYEYAVNQTQPLSGNLTSGLGTANLQQEALQPERAPQIATQLEILEKELACHGDLLGRLEGQLQPAMSLAPKSGGKDSNSRNEPTCPIASRLSGMAIFVAQQNRLLADIIQRLEI